MDFPPFFIRVYNHVLFLHSWTIHPNEFYLLLNWLLKKQISLHVTAVWQYTALWRSSNHSTGRNRGAVSQRVRSHGYDAKGTFRLFEAPLRGKVSPICGYFRCCLSYVQSMRYDRTCPNGRRFNLFWLWLSKTLFWRLGDGEGVVRVVDIERNRWGLLTRVTVRVISFLLAESGIKLLEHDLEGRVTA